MGEDLSKLWELRRLVQEFEKLDKDLITAYKEKNIDNFTDYLIKIVKIKMDIKKFISTDLKVAIDPSLAIKLKNIRDNIQYNIDKLFPDEDWRERQYNIAQEKMLEQFYEKGCEEDIDYFYENRKHEIGTIICSTSLNQNIIRNLEKLKECYANGLFDAAIIFCRAIIEYVTFELQKRKGLIPKNVSDMGSYKLTNGLKRIERYINPKTFSKIVDIKELAGDILHSKNNWNMKSIQITPLEAIRWTFIFVEEIHNVK